MEAPIHNELSTFDSTKFDNFEGSVHDPKDESTSLTNTQRPSESSPTTEEQQGSSWSSGLFSGFQRYPHYMALQLGCCCCVNAYVYSKTVNAYQQKKNLCLESVCFLAACCTLASCALGVSQRSKLRVRYGMQLNSCQDVAVHCCCQSCALIQELDHVMRMESDKLRGLDENSK
mmetsp:Transcript_5873/g.20750  ORF Transcript_5873/g.20750 Transcript_5873/m.20750 type:complete len:174 (+) Transcript_5873:385-906(+)